MPKIVRIAVAASLLFSFSKSLSAETVTATGVIDAVDRSSDTITVRRKTATGEKTAKFKLGGATKILFDGQVSGLHRFEAGQKVEVTYDTKAKQVTKLEAWPDSPAADNVPPDGFVALFNGKDLTGWKGVLAPPLDNAAKRAKASPGQLAKAQREADIEMRKHWSVRDGVLVFDGQGSSLATVKDYGDFELWVDWKIEPRGDSGIYLHGMPQVQIWDTANNAAKGVGSGGLFNNQNHPSRPQVVADKPVGEWNTFKITMVGERVNVTLNDVVVVDNVVLENFWEPKKPAYSTGPIELQKHGSRLYFKNIYLRELVRGGAENDVSAADADGNASELFNGKDLTGWSLKKPREIGIDNQWFVDRERKVLISPGGNGSNWLESEKRYKNFLLSLEYRFPPGGQQGGNGSGVVVRAGSLDGRGHNPRGIEIELHAKVLEQGTGTYVCYESPLKTKTEECKPGQPIAKLVPFRFVQKPTGEWNKLEIECDDDRITVKVNDEVVNEGTGAKVVAGKICLRNQSTAVEFRNIRIKSIE